MGPPPPAAPTSVVSLNSWAASSSAQGIAPLSPLQSAGVPMIYQRPNSRPAKPPPALPTAKGSAARVPNLGDFPKLTPTAPSQPPARAKQVNQGDGILQSRPLCTARGGESPTERTLPGRKAPHRGNAPTVFAIADITSRSFPGLGAGPAKGEGLVPCGTSANGQAEEAHRPRIGS